MKIRVVRINYNYLLDVRLSIWFWWLDFNMEKKYAQNWEITQISLTFYCNDRKNTLEFMHPKKETKCMRFSQSVNSVIVNCVFFSSWNLEFWSKTEDSAYDWLWRGHPNDHLFFKSMYNLHRLILNSFEFFVTMRSETWPHTFGLLHIIMSINLMLDSMTMHTAYNKWKRWKNVHEPCFVFATLAATRNYSFQ